MKKLILIFCSLLIIFVGLWALKVKTPLGRPDAYAYGVDEKAGAWWLGSNEIPEPDDVWTLDPELPLNYIPVLGRDEVYMVIGEDGKIIEYRKRTKQEDGSWLWEDTDPNIPESYEAVEGLENVYKVTKEDGSVSYLRYVRNDDDTFCFVEVGENGNELNAKMPDGMQIPENYHRVKGNVYAVLNEHSVVTGYRERILNDDGTYTWVESEKPKDSSTGSEKPAGTNDSKKDGNGSEGGQNQQGEDGITIINPGMEKEEISGGGYIETETIIDIKTTGGWKITYQTIVTRTYDAKGKLVSTKKEGPTEISKVQSIAGGESAPDASRVEATLSAEYQRVTSGLAMKTNLAQEILALLNAERNSNGLAPVTMDANSTVSQLAGIKAADMALYNHADFDSPVYGTIGELLSRYGISSAAPSETLWRTTANKSAKEIHIRFQAQEYSRNARMNPGYAEVGIGIMEKNGYFYIAEVFI